MQAIITKYIPATNTRGSRIKAKCERGSITISYPDELRSEDVHIFAAKKLVEKFTQEDLKQYGTPLDKNPWMKPRASGELPDGSTAHVFID